MIFLHSEYSMINHFYQKGFEKAESEKTKIDDDQ